MTSRGKMLVTLATKTANDNVKPAQSSLMEQCHSANSTGKI